MKRSSSNPLISFSLKISKFNNDNDSASNDTTSFARCTNLLSPGFNSSLVDFHPLVGSGYAEILRDPVFYNAANDIMTSYITDKKYGQVIPYSENILPELPLVSVNTYQLEGAFNNDVVSQICEWMNVIKLFLKQKKMKIEPFQLEMFAEALVFVACSLAPDHIDILFKLIGTYLGKPPETLHLYKGKHAAFIVMRRQGKTEWTQIMFSGALVTLHNFEMIYFSYTALQVKPVIEAIRDYAKLMSVYSATKQRVIYNKHSSQVTYGTSTVRGKSSHNVNVSIGATVFDVVVVVV